MSEQTIKQEIVDTDIEDGASVLEILRALERRYPEEQGEGLKQWLCEYLQTQVESQALGFYIDEFGAKDVVDVSAEQATAMLAGSDVWRIDSETMLHPYFVD